MTARPTEPAELALQVRGLRKAYPKVVAVEHLDLEVRRGEVFGLLGPNGAGKTPPWRSWRGSRSRMRARSGCWGWTGASTAGRSAPDRRAAAEHQPVQ